MDALVAALAGSQHGVVAAPQCLALGMTRRQIVDRVRAGRWHIVHRGVYAVGHRALSDRGRYWAAVLACGDGAVTSHRTAASLWLLQPHHKTWPHVTTPTHRRQQKGIVVHRTGSLERARRQGVPVTGLARTLRDLARIAGPDETETAIRAAERIHGFNRAILDRPPPKRYTRGYLEKLLVAVLVEAELELPELNVLWEGIELDAVWWGARLVAEVDDWETHGDRDSFGRDRRRDRKLSVAQLRPIRLTYEDLTDGRAEMLRDLRALGVKGVRRLDP